MSGTKTNLLDLDRAGLESLFATMGERAFRATQVMKWIYHLGEPDFSKMTNLAKGLRQLLSEQCEITVPGIAAHQQSSDGTQKWVLNLADYNAVEMVFIPEDDRGTLCISSQVGCALDCQFCATGRQGFSRNLTTGEIVAQVWLANQQLGGEVAGQRVITNVVFMGMGEPLLNFSNVVRASNLIMDDLGFGLSKRRVTISTAGVVPAIERLAAVSEVSLAVSLHAADDATRDLIMPLNRKYPLATLIAACKNYLQRDSRRRVTIEYVLLAGINDTKEQARALVQLLRGVPAKVNLIPYNSAAGAKYRAPSAATVDGFRDILMAANITTITRKQRGNDIDAACGQLVGRVKSRHRDGQRKG